MVAAVWLAASWRSERLEAQAVRVAIDPSAPRGQRLEALTRARRARALQPDAGPKVTEWALQRALGRRLQAQALLTAVVLTEPANLPAWRLLATAAERPSLRREAQRRVRALRPR